jgi:two-component system CheB/CheR fusion protein
MLLNARALRNTTGRPERILLGIQDVTEQMQVQAALGETQTRYRALVDASAQIVWTTDPTGAVVEDSPSWRAFTGQSHEQWKGFGWLDALHPDDRARVSEQWLRTVAARTPLEIEYRVRHVSGAWRWTVARVVPVLNADGSVREYVGMNTDITERKDAEEVRRETAAALQQLSAELAEADRRKNHFLAMLAHELRGPLAPLRNALQLIRQGDGNPDTVGPLAAMMERQIGHLVRLVDDLLDVSRIARGKITLQRAPLALASVVNDAVEAARPYSAGKNQRLIVTLPPQPLYVSGDATRLNQVVGNLLNNACKFTERDGSIWLIVEQDGGQAVMRVRDTGIGIAKHELPRIFDIFAQVDVSLERGESGLGIGLTIVKNLVEMHDGTVDARSAGAGQGSEFVIRLPILDDPTITTPATPVNESRAPQSGVPPPETSGTWTKL